jgi:alanine racemase
MAYIKLHKDNFFHNLKEIEKKVGSKDKIAIVLKDNAYGHGIEEIATLAKEYGVKKAVVKDIREAKIISNLFDKVIVLNFTSNDFENKNFEICINSLDDIENIKPYTNVHLKVDTGMHRNGINIIDIDKAFEKIVEKSLNLVGVFTHMRSADELSSELFWQMDNFNNIKTRVKELSAKYNINLPSFHSQASSAIFRMNNHDDFVRVGIAVYGYIYLPVSIQHPILKPVMSLWAEKISTRDIKAGEKIGYGGGYLSRVDQKISTYDIGYGDGFFRLNEKQKYITPHGYSILGRVSMDNMSISSCDDEVCIFDDVSALAKICNTITYDIIVKLNPNIKKIIV